MTTTYKICLLAGDGIGPEIIAEGREGAGRRVRSTTPPSSTPTRSSAVRPSTRRATLPQATLDAARASDAVPLAAVGGPKWDTTDPNAPRPEQGLFGYSARSWACTPTCAL